MKGEMVIVRDWRGRAFIRRIWRTSESVVFITNDVNLQLLINKDPLAIEPIGVPKEDVFKYDSKLAKEIDKSSDKGCFIWDNLTPLIE
jgi:hypothetical protein